MKESFGIYNFDECRGLEKLPLLPNGSGQTQFITRNLMPLSQAAKGVDPNAQAQGGSRYFNIAVALLLCL
jgi:hypothetical protein